jgi:hypothetical protein
VLRNLDAVEELAGSGALLMHVNAAAVAIRVPDGVGSALGDSGEERLGCERPIDVTF